MTLFDTKAVMSKILSSLLHGGFFLQHNYAAKVADTSPYCKYDDQIYQLCISCLYLAAAVAAVCTEVLARKLGRKVTFL